MTHVVWIAALIPGALLLGECGPDCVNPRGLGSCHKLHRHTAGNVLAASCKGRQPYRLAAGLLHLVPQFFLEE